MSKDTQKTIGQKNTKRLLQQQFDALMQQVHTSRVHFRNVVENNVDGIVLLNNDNHILYMNPAAEQLFGEARADMVGQLWSHDVPLLETVDSVIQGGASPERFVEMRGVNTEWEGVPAVLISIRDITERQAAEAQIRMLNAELEFKVAHRTEQLEALNRELEAFNYAVSHDLRTPLARIDGYASILLSEIGEHLEPENVHFLERIRASVSQMVELTDGLLHLSRLNKRPMEAEEFSLSTLAENILDAWQQDEPGRAVRLRIQPDMIVRADYVLIRAAMENLLSNAWKFTRKTEIAEISVSCTTQNHETIYSVRDNGVGFDMASASRLFQAFQRLHADELFPGTGVGLTTVRRIIHRHQGRVWAESDIGKGAVFYFTLPGAPVTRR
ncbi:MAG: PAS domain S-box protein [Deltaproteobacteria bacterium]|nr:PAS domain S-box protein [Deltaproteobacteria bacterium]MBN2673878.1 PAS domain S-box protein [Deltaproteobacteria bacterium]